MYTGKVMSSKSLFSFFTFFDKLNNKNKNTNLISEEKD